MNIVFMGSSDFSMPALISIHKNHDILAVYTNPAKPSGRGMKITKTPVQEFAEKNCIQCFTPTNLKEEINRLRSLSPDVIVVAAYGFILPKTIIDIAKLGCINIHGSLLPKWRGASPIQYSLLSGESETGITIMLMDAGMDTGDIILQNSIKIDTNDNYLTLKKKLANLGANSITKFLESPENYLAKAVKQNNNLASYTKKFTKEDMHINFTESAESINNIVRAFYPNSWFKLNNLRIKVLESTVIKSNENLNTGTLIDKDFTVSCGKDSIQLSLIKQESKNTTTGRNFLLNRKDLDIGSIINAN